MMAKTPRELIVDARVGQTSALVYEAKNRTRRPTALVLAHGAGAPQHHPFMVSFAHALSDRGLDVLTFDFLYIAQKRKVPDRMPQLVACYRAAIEVAREEIPSARERLFIGGKSMGGRVATHVAAGDRELAIDGIVLLGYPLHPPGRPDQLRDAHLPDVQRPMLFVQGARDTFGTPSELKPILASLSPLPTLHHVDGGDHSFKVAGRDAKTRQAAIFAEIQDTIVEWIHRVD
jgi:predicted alpha/beta-hydrolase family hydrolase